MYMYMYMYIKGTIEFVIICTQFVHPPFAVKDANFCTLIHSYTEKCNYYSIVRTTNRKHSEMAFLTSSSASRYVLFALGVNPTARDGGSNLVSRTTPFTVLCATSSRPCSLTTQVQYHQALQDIKQMLQSFPLKFTSRSLMAER